MTDERTQSSETTTNPEFSATDLVIGYPGLDEPVIDGESIQVPPGDITALIGPNGSGKSTLLKGFADQLTPDAGTVLLDGQTIDSLGAKELARKLGLLSQENVSPDGLSVEDLVERGRYPHQGFFDSMTDTDWQAIEDAIELAGVEHLREREVGDLSGGQKQLVWIAMALAQDTDILLLDEPTTFLDLHHQLEVMSILESLRDDAMTVVVVLHDVEQAIRYADHVVALDEGSIYDYGPPAEAVTESLLTDVFDIEAAILDTEYGRQIVPLDPAEGSSDRGSETPADRSQPNDGSGSDE